MEKRIEKNKQKFRDLWNFITHTKIGIMNISEEEKEAKETEGIFKELKNRNIKFNEKLTYIFK